MTIKVTRFKKKTNWKENTDNKVVKIIGLKIAIQIEK